MEITDLIKQGEELGAKLKVFNQELRQAILFELLLQATIETQFKFTIEVLDTFGNNTRSDDDDWSNYVSEEQIKAWLLERDEDTEEYNSDKILS